MAEITVGLIGVTPLIMNSDRGLDDFDLEVQELKKLTQRRDKSLEDLRLIEFKEWMLRIYFDPEIGIYFPSDNIEEATGDAAGKYKRGLREKWKTAFQLYENKIKLLYDGPQDLDELRADRKFYHRTSVGLPGRSGRGVRVMTSRPIFPVWSLKFSAFLDEQVNPEDARAIFELTGLRVGIGARRPKFGRFNVKVVFNGHR